jgi:ATP-dependent RNA helicase SUPV3L1/SUV3
MKLSFCRRDFLSKLAVVYPQAVEQTKLKLYEDIDRYLEQRETLPSFEQYIADRRHYIEQIWINVWLNKVTNDVSKNEKKDYLSEKGFEVHGVDRKLINKLFRDEMREYQPFDALAYLYEIF